MPKHSSVIDGPRDTSMNQTEPYEDQLRRWLDTFEVGLWDDLQRVADLPAETGQIVLKGLLELACQSQHVHNIELGRRATNALPREWAISQIHHAACAALDLDDEWEYRRLLELYEMLGGQLLPHLVAYGQAHTNAEIREAAADFAGFTSDTTGTSP